MVQNHAKHLICTSNLMFIVDCFLIRSTREVWSVITGKTSLNDPVRSIVYFVKFRHSCLDETLPHYLQFLEHSDFFSFRQRLEQSYKDVRHCSKMD